MCRPMADDSLFLILNSTEVYVKQFIKWKTAVIKKNIYKYK